MSRPVLRDFPSSLKSLGGTCTKTSVGVDAAGVAGVSVSFWLKYSVANGQNFLQFLLNAGTKNGLRINVEATTQKLFLFTNDSGGTGHTLLKPTNMLSRHVAHHIVFTEIWDQASLVTGRLIVDGVDWGSATYAGDIQTTDTFRTTGGNTGADIVTDVIVYPRVLSLQEAQDIYFRDQLAATIALRWKMNEGGGPTAFDSSGNGLNGTIVSSIFVNDTPMRLRRRTINENMIFNGDFEYAPPFVAAQTATSSKWIDGTAAGASIITAQRLNGFISNNGTIQFDTVDFHSGTKSLKLSLTGVNSYIEIFQASISNGLGSYFGKHIPVLPNTSYTFSFWMKTDYVSGDSSDGAFCPILESLADGTSASLSNNGTKVKTTTPWTQYTRTFTTGASTAYVQFDPRVYGHTGAATLQMSANFDDLILLPTAVYARTVAAARAAASARAAA